VVWLGIPTWQLFGGQGALNVLLGTQWDPIAGAVGLLPFLYGSLLVTVVALAVALPLGLAVAVALEYVLAGSRRWLLSLLTAMGAVPSVIYGWWALATIVPALRRLDGSGFSLLAAGLVVAVMVLPSFAVLARQALAAVPAEVLEGALALGATDDQALWRVLLPAAADGLRAAGLLALARALGETMAVQMVVGGQAYVGWSIPHPGATLTSQILTDLASLPEGTPGHQALDVMALLLLVAMALVARATLRWRGRAG
jgi:phosphate transport system permease protein